jgi:hypothetical protein
VSLDQRIVQALPPPTPYRSLELGVAVRGNEVRHRINYQGPANPLPPRESPVAVHAQLFANAMTGPNELALIRQQRKSVLDVVTQQFSAMRNRISAADRQKVDQHYTLVRQIERRLDAPVAGECTVPDSPPFMNVNNEDNMDELAVLQTDLLVSALACDQTRIATLQMSSGANNIRFTHLNSTTDDHQLSHAGPSDTPSLDERARRQTWYAERFAQLLAGLKAVPEGNGTLLDQTVVLWCNELGQGNTHSHNNAPFLLAGSCGGQFATGRYLQFGGVPHNNLLLSLLHAMGVEDETFGDAEFATGPLTELNG